MSSQMNMNSVEQDLECVVKVTLEKHCTIVIQTRFQKNPILVHVQLRPEVRTFALLERDNTGNEFSC